ncbi:hypothetical protein EB796_007445 [Bugula neritina]|uniref:Uncharacterized protein n=1 Tax=Bugula neritina TaxID=10212 RepID=A0A7J7K6J8_BUGNE|nr:hypothetical protein EB796_007445 [Bugula neritina]
MNGANSGANALGLCRLVKLSQMGQKSQQEEPTQASSLIGRLKAFIFSLKLPESIRDNKRSLFIFSEDNLVRKYAKIIIEWGYPLHTTRC